MFSKPKAVGEPVPNPSKVSSAPSLMSADMRIEGSVITQGEIQMDGTLKGDVRCGAIVLGEQGIVEGSIMAERVIVRGSVKGNIHARSVRLEKTARIAGDVIHETIAIEAGAKVEGRFVPHTSTQPIRESRPQGVAAKPSEEQPEAAPAVQLELN